MNTMLVIGMGLFGITALIGLAGVLTFHAEISSWLKEFRLRKSTGYTGEEEDQDEEGDFLILRTEEELRAV